MLSIAQVIEHHRHTHAREVLMAACQRAMDDGCMEAVVKRFTTMTRAVARN